MKVVVLNANKMRTKEEMHAFLKDAFHFPEYYGKNLDALHDCLSEVRKKTLVIFKNLEDSESPLCGAYEVFCDAASENECIRVEKDR